MSLVIIALVSMATALLTFFSGFGLGTILMPVLAIFFPVELAIAMTAIVHLANNLFKMALVGRHTHWKTVAQFGIPAIVAAFGGAFLLSQMAETHAVASYTLWSSVHTITATKLVIGMLMIGFSLVDIWPRFQSMTFDRRYLPLGGTISGFFGGLSGHQGALRAAFLSRAGLDAKAFIATSVVIASLVDIIRLAVYAEYIQPSLILTHQQPIMIAIGFAFAGSFIGRKILHKVTMPVIQYIVGLFLILLGLALASGII